MGHIASTIQQRVMNKCSNLPWANAQTFHGRVQMLIPQMILDLIKLTVEINHIIFPSTINHILLIIIINSYFPPSTSPPRFIPCNSLFQSSLLDLYIEKCFKYWKEH